MSQDQKIVFSYQNTCAFSSHEIARAATKIQATIDSIGALLSNTMYETEYASLHVPFDAQMGARINDVIAQKKKLNPSMLIVVGIGGSNLGTLAVWQALCGMLYNEYALGIKIYCADTVDTDYMHSLLELAKKELEQGNTILINVVSKSGTTTETSANFQVLLDLMRQYKKDDYAQCVIVTTDKHSKLWQIAQQEQFVCLEIPRNVGGRFSVFSAVGLFPLGLLGIDADLLLEGAREAIKIGTVYDTDHNSALISATLLYLHYKNNKNIHDTFLFSVDLEGIGKWYRQLLAESIGKEYDAHDNKVNIGITPTVSVGSTDLHSMGQLYLAGPHDKFTTFITVAQSRYSVRVPCIKNYGQLVEKIQGKSLTTLMNAIIQGTQKAYQHQSLPYVTWQFSEKTAWHIGYLLQSKMLEIIYLGALLEINVFDQPNVEYYKQETRKILAHE